MLIIVALLAWGLRARSKGRNNMRVCIHRGTKQIGGTCVEIEASGSRIIVDLGLPLDAVEADPALVPQISGLREHDPSLLAIVLSHGHRDHWGLVPKVRPDIPIVIGKATERMMRAAADFVPDAFAPNAWQHLESGKPLQIGPFAITPHLVDHSGFDAYALPSSAKQIQSLLRQKLRLNLIAGATPNALNKLGKLEVSSDVSDLRIVVALVDYNPYSKTLSRDALRELSFAKQIDLFFLGFGMWKENAVKLNEV